MALILNIDTATEYASACISNDGQTLTFRESTNQKEHASFLHVAIKAMLDEAGLLPAAIDAVAITSGPGSYTGLRVSMAAAKGWCYAMKKPLIAVNTLEVMAFAAKEYLSEENKLIPDTLLCPMIDARRMEVFTALYDAELNVLLTPCSMILEPNSFEAWKTRPLHFFGTGAQKTAVLKMEPATIVECQHSASHLATLSLDLFNRKIFSDMAYIEPQYLKEFYSTSRV